MTAANAANKGPVLNPKNRIVHLNNLGTSQMRTTTLETIAGRTNEETLGVVRATALWSKRVMKYNHGGLRGLQYTTMDDLANGLNEAKEAAEAKTIAQALAMGADAIVGLRLEIFEMSEGLFTAVATGTAVRTAALPMAMPAFAPAAANDDDDEAFMPLMARQPLRVVSHLMH